MRDAFHPGHSYPLVSHKELFCPLMRQAIGAVEVPLCQHSSVPTRRLPVRRLYS